MLFVLVILKFLEKKLNAWKRVFFFSFCKKQYLHLYLRNCSCFPKEKSSIFIPKEKSSICRDSLIFQPLYNYMHY